MAETMERITTEQEGIQKFAEAVFKVTRRGENKDNNSMFLAGIVVGYSLNAEMLNLEPRKQAMV